MIDIACRIDRRKEQQHAAVFLFLLFLSRHPSSRARSPVLSLSPDLSRKITSTCNSVATCNASLGRYRKRHSRSLVTTALKRRSIFRRCVSPVLYTPRRLSPRGGPCLSRRSPPLPRAISHCAQGEAELPSPLLRPCLPSFRRAPSSRVLVSRLATSKPLQSLSQ